MNNPTPHPLEPSVCTPPTPPLPGQPGYGPDNPFPQNPGDPGIIYWDPNLQVWIIVIEGITGEPPPINEFITLIESLKAAYPPPPPSWAMSDRQPDGTYWFPGGYFNDHYFGAGYYSPAEIY